MKTMVAAAALAAILALPLSAAAQDATDADSGSAMPAQGVPEVRTNSASKTDRAPQSEHRTPDAGPDGILATSLIGSDVYTITNEHVGSVNDLIVQEDGRVAGVVIGFGGFLGLGERNVAIDLNQLQIRDGGSGRRVLLKITMAELEAAPESPGSVSRRPPGFRRPER